jgi:hypothetical protein
MAEPIILDANITPLKKQLKDATQELQVARQKFGDLSTEAVAAAKKVAAIRDAVAAANEQAALFDPGKRFQALTSAASLAAGAVGAVQGAMALFGAESEDVQKALLKVQSAMALSQGLSQLADLSKVTEELKSSFKGLTATTAQKVAATGADTAAVVTNTAATKTQGIVTKATSLATKAATIATNLLRAATSALLSPMGLLIIAAGVVAANFDNIKKFALNAIPGLANFGKTISGLAQGFTDLIGITSQANRELQAISKGTEARNESIEFQIKLLGAQGNKEKEIYELKRKQNKQELTDLFLADAIDKKTDEEREKRKKEILNNITLDTAAFNKKQSDDAKAAADKQAADAKVASDKANAKKKEADQKIIDDKKALDEKTAAEDIEFQKRLNEVLTESRLAAIKDENDRARAELLAIQEKELADLAVDTNLREDQKLALEKQLKIRNKQELDALEQTFVEEQLLKDLEDLDAEAAKITTTFERQREIVAEQEKINLELQGKTEDQRTAIVEAAAKQREAIDMAELTAKTDMQNKYFDLAAQFGNVMQQFAGKNKKLAIAGVIVEQSAAIGSIISNTAAANAKAVSATPLTGGLPFTAINTISAGLSIASTIRGAVKAIQGINNSSSITNGGIQAPQGISASAPSVGSSVPTIGSSPVTALGTMMQNQPPLRAYVVESEVTGTQRRVADIERRAGF